MSEGEQFLVTALLESKDAEDLFRGPVDDVYDKDGNVYEADAVRQYGGAPGGAGGGRDDDDGSAESDYTFLRMIRTVVIVVIAGSGAVVCAGAIAVVPGVVVIVAAAIGIINAPAVVYKESQIMRMPITRKLINDTREEKNRLTQSNDYLMDVIEDFEQIVGRVGPVNEKLQEVMGSQGACVNQFIELVKENEKIVTSTMEHMQASVFQEVLRTVIKNNTDNNGLFDAKEAKELALQILSKLDDYGVESFDVITTTFVRAIRLDPSISGSIEVAKCLLPKGAGLDNHDDSTSDDACEGSDSSEDSSESEEEIYDIFDV